MLLCIISTTFSLQSLFLSVISLSRGSLAVVVIYALFVNPKDKTCVCKLTFCFYCRRRRLVLVWSEVEVNWHFFFISKYRPWFPFHSKIFISRKQTRLRRLLRNLCAEVEIAFSIAISLSHSLLITKFCTFPRTLVQFASEHREKCMIISCIWGSGTLKIYQHELYISKKKNHLIYATIYRLSLSRCN